MAQSNDNDNTQVAKVTQFIKDTAEAIMATTTTIPDADAAPGTEAVVVPLLFVREAVIQQQHYILELHKEQGSLWLKELTVNWVPEKDANPPGEMLCTIVTNDVEGDGNLAGCGSRGFYQVVCETSEDFKYFVRLHVYRL